MPLTTTPESDDKSIVRNVIKQLNRSRSNGAYTHQYDLTEDELFLLLSSSRKRSIVRSVWAAEDGLPMHELVREVAVREENLAPGDISKKLYKRIYVSCHQTHLPALEEADAITVEDGHKIIRPGANLPCMMEVLTSSHELLR